MRDIRVNHRIRAKEIRVIGNNGEQLGVMSLGDALRKAQEVGLDVVEVAPAASPPVCRIMDFSKYKYQQSKREREAKKHQRVIHIKELRMKPRIEEHDYQVKRLAAERFLTRGDKVKMTLVFRGREMSHIEVGRGLLDRMVADLAGIADIERPPFLEGRFLTAIFTAKPEVKKTKERNQENQEN